MKTKRIVSVLITLCMVVSMLPIMSSTVKAAEITSSINLIGSVSINGDGWSWDSVKKELTLSGINLKMAAKHEGGAIQLPNDSKIILTPNTTNTIELTAGGDRAGIFSNGNITISGKGKLNISVKEGSGIYVHSGNVTVEESTIDIKCVDNGIHSGDRIFINNGATITIDTSLGYRTSCGIQAVNDIKINSSIVTAIATPDSYGNLLGILSEQGSIIISDSNDIGSFVVATSIVPKISPYTNTNSIVFVGNTGTMNGNVNLAKNAIVPNESTLTIPAGQTLTTNSGVTFTNNGTIVNNGTIINNGIIANYGMINGTGTINGTGIFSATGITGVPTSMTAGTPLTLSGTVVPADATNKNIVWSIKGDATATGASIDGNILSTTNAVTVTVTATITNGATANTNYTQDFVITVNPAPVAPTITTPTLPNGTVGVAYSQTLTATGDAAIIWNTASILPQGLSLSNYGVISGTPTEAVTAEIILIATNSAGSNTKSLSIKINPAPVAFVAVTNITGVPTTVTARTNLSLTGTVAPTNSTNQAIVWSVKDASTTGASISENILSTTNKGTVTVTATITNGATANTNYSQDFVITVNPAPVAFVAVTNITGVPTTVTAGTNLSLTGTVVPTNATNQTIVWSVKDASTTGASISGSNLSTTNSGTVTVTATITNGATESTNYTQDFVITVNPAPVAFVAVTNIAGVPTTVTARINLSLTGTVAPTNSTNQVIVWSVKDASTTGASISGNILSTTSSGEVTVTATITNGATASTNYSQDFVITVNPVPVTFVAVTNITGVPTTVTAGTNLSLTGTVAPTNSTNQAIVWSVKDANTTGASISGNTLSTTNSGTVTVTATITNGATASTNYSLDFVITVNPAPVTPTPTPVPSTIWEIIAKQLATENGVIVTHKMDGATELPTNFINSITSENSTLVLDMGSYSWSIACGTIETVPSGLIGYNMGVRKINESGLRTLVTNKEVVQLELLHNGPFNFTPVLKWLVGTQYKGKTIHLNYYNEVTGKLEQIGSSITDDNGYVLLEFTHASKYVLTTSANENIVVTKNPTTGANDYMALAIAMAIFSILILVGRLVILKKQKYN